MQQIQCPDIPPPTSFHFASASALLILFRIPRLINCVSNGNLTAADHCPSQPEAVEYPMCSLRSTTRFLPSPCKHSLIDSLFVRHTIARLAAERLHKESSVATHLSSTASSSRWTPLGRGSDGRFGLRRFRAKLTPTPFGTHRAFTHALPPSYGLRSVPFTVPPCFFPLPLK